MKIVKIALMSTLISVAPIGANNNNKTVAFAATAQTESYSTIHKRFKKDREEKIIKDLKKKEKEQLEEQKRIEEEKLKKERKEKENIKVASNYTDLSVPSNKPFKSYMDAKFITNKSSAQYKLKSQYTLDNTGIYMVNGRYCCALGSYYTTNIGTNFDIIMKSGKVIPCVLADVKADAHTDKLHQYTVANGSIVEFVVNTKTLINNIGRTGNVSSLGGIFEGEIACIRIYK